MKKKIVSAGHICLDIIPVFPDENKTSNIEKVLIPGTLVQVDPAQIHTGGSVANTGLALKRLGLNVSLIAKTGTDAFGTIISDILKQYDADGIVQDPDSSTSYSVVLSIPGLDRIFLHNPGANNTFCSDDVSDEELQDTALFHIGYPSVMKKLYENDGAELETLLKRVKSKGIATSLDLAAIDPKSEAGQLDWNCILEKIIPYVDFFVPSFEELLFMMDKKLYFELEHIKQDVTDHLDMELYVKPMTDRLLDMGAKVILIKCGTSGMYLRSNQKEVLQEIGNKLDLSLDNWADLTYIQPCYKAENLRSANGAGDASIAAFLAALTENRSPLDCVKLAAAEGACAVTEYDALSGVKPLQELDQKLQSGWELLY